MSTDTFWLVVLTVALVYQIVIHEIVGILIHRYRLSHPGWLVLRYSGVPILLLAMIVMLVREWLHWMSL